ncbi:sulfoxide reductase heme-binding subunit YedZ [Komagataeibacter rhaeticus]|uniref:protein-methionine-sulfoxide reductase heme-binding subunit MsrQ n=1 Tax=Komagataeibacter rhaeticus TaxID=215221 RepID=UPI0004D5252E|nr:protein-methionine-sulfoxide reductase heme-binding subunit MsrQ [Komagataeibacter rhaeticus]KDU96340.1 sulfite oxidase [Komagataeibacter rhaeticus AF1]MBL7239559.1 protein-methionine-sulfoxide reductase heme-binding subunit MsrQ [Komagataeibacter rhaeticus]PYD53545.1 sulfoxide reductase heme-binding subunit YedZ [Komagataeibacter rhaeticus]GBQ09520.1 sulfite oxidase subunit YedZ [Komagataeibacter rhaeticus DSM 16663]
MPYLSGTPRNRLLVPWRGERAALALLGLLPAILYFWYGAHDALGPDPVNVFERWLGLWAVRFLLAGLLVTPLRVLTGLNLIRYRRMLGLLAFCYVCLHVGVYVGLDQQGNIGVLVQDLTRRPFLMIGFAAFMLMVPLAITSTDGAMRRLGRRWGRLHRLVYGVALLVAVHFLMAFKTYNVTSVTYAGLLMAMVVWRCQAAWRRWRRRAA